MNLAEHPAMRRSFVSLAMLLVLGLMLSPALSQTTEGKKYALLVGVNNYDHANFPNLKFAENDANELGAFLRTTGYQVTVLASKDARLGSVRAELTKLVKGRKRADLVLVGLAGHGLQFNDKNGNYFCTTDAEPKDAKTMLPLSEVYELLADCGAGARFLLVDACRNEGTRGLKRGGIDTPHQTPPGVGALFSCSPGQFSFESPDLKHGVFFYHVLEALKGKTREDDGEVTWDGLRAYVKRQVSKKVPELFPDARQEPNDVGNLSALPPLVRLANVAAPEKKTQPLAKNIEQSEKKAVSKSPMTAVTPEKKGLPSQQHRPIFNGSDLTGWRPAAGSSKEGWHAKGGILIVQATVGGGGWLLTENRYKDFILNFEFTLSPEANSGIALRAEPDDWRNVKKDPSMEIQLFDDDSPRYAKVRDEQRTGALYSLALDRRARLVPRGQWNAMEIELNGQALRVNVNGEQVLKTNLDRYAAFAKERPALARTSGHLGIQQHTGTVSFRNFQIKELAGR
jgi:uncharacterized caspase-like protein